MPVVSPQEWENLEGRFRELERLREGWWTPWQDVSSYFLPRRYPWLATSVPVQGQRPRPETRSSKLLDSTSSRALRTLATGMMNGITSPSRPWFRLKQKSKKFEEMSDAAARWFEKATEILLTLMNQTNFYNSLDILYLEWCGFGTSSMGIYPDDEDVFRCHNFSIGEFYLGRDAKGRVARHGRKFLLTLEQLREKVDSGEWDEAGVGARIAMKLWPRDGGIPTAATLGETVTITCLVEPNDGDMPGVARSAKSREMYWISETATKGFLLAARGRKRKREVSPRWEVYGDDVYGTSPAMEVLPDVLQLQVLIKRQAQGLDKQINPPMLAHVSLRNNRKSWNPGEVTYVAGADLAQGARPLYSVQFPYMEVENKIQQTKVQIKEGLFNDLFRMISDLATVRSASEVDARREEKLILLAPILERFESEGLAPLIECAFDIAMEAGQFPPLPPELEGEELDFQYTSMLSDAQRSVGALPTERWLQILGGVIQMFPEAINIPDWEVMLRDYADAIGVKVSHRRPKEDSEAMTEASAQQGALAQAADVGVKLSSGAKQLSETQVGGGANALQAMMGGM